MYKFYVLLAVWGCCGACDSTLMVSPAGLTMSSGNPNMNATPTSPNSMTPFVNDEMVTVTLQPNTTYQSIDGFGGGTYSWPAATEYSQLTAAQAECLYGKNAPGVKLGFNLLRLPLRFTESNGNQPLAYSAEVVNGKMLQSEYQAQTIATVWQEPNAYTVTEGNSVVLTDGNYDLYAEALVHAIDNYNRLYGIHFDYISPQNEPDDVLPTGDGGTYFTAAQYAKLFALVANTLAVYNQNQLNKTWLLGPETCESDDFGKYVAAIDWNQSITRSQTGVLATHQYHAGSLSIDLSQVPAALHVWMTERTDEVPGQTVPVEANDTLAYGLLVASDMHVAFTTLGLSAWMYWNLKSPHGSSNSGPGLWDEQNNVLGYHGLAMAHFSSFLPPVAERFMVTCQSTNPNDANVMGCDANSDLLISGYKTAGSWDGFSVVMINRGSNGYALTFNLQQPFEGRLMSFVTDANRRLQADFSQPTLQNGNRFTYVISPNSMVTVMGSSIDNANIYEQNFTAANLALCGLSLPLVN